MFANTFTTINVIEKFNRPGTEDVVDTYYFMYDDAYGCEHTFSFKASYGPAMQLAEELDGDGDHDCLTVYDSDLNPIYPLPF